LPALGKVRFFSIFNRAISFIFNKKKYFCQNSIIPQFPLEKWMGGMVKLILPAYRRQGFQIAPNGPSYCKQAQAEMLDKKRS